MDTQTILCNMVNAGGKILIVGGGLNKLPQQYFDHPRIMIWDDEVDSIENRTVPSTVKAIMWNRFVSHKTMGKLNQAVQGLHALKFPMLKTGQIKSLLSGIIPVNANYIDEEIEKEPSNLPNNDTLLDPVLTEPVIVEEPIMAKRHQVKLGSLKDFIAKHLKIDADYSVRGSIAREGNRLFHKAQNEGLKTTEGSVIQAVSKTLKDLSKAPATTAKIAAKTAIIDKAKQSDDDFEQLDNLLTDALTAMKLIQEHMPKVKREVEKLRSAREKMLKLLE